MATWITSDIHFGHKNIIKFSGEQRPYKDLDEMHEAIVDKWNTKVGKEDTIYILGDVSFSKVTKTTEFLNTLNGKKILIKGNHDTSHVKRQEFIDCFESIHDYMELQHNKKHIVMFHFPIANWHRVHYGAIHFHGHCHGAPSHVTGRIKDVGMDTNYCEVYNMDELVEEMLELPLKPHGYAGVKGDENV